LGYLYTAGGLTPPAFYYSVMFALNNQEVLQLSQYFLTAPFRFYDVVSSFVSDAYNCGARPMELLEISRWSDSMVNPGYWTMQPQKGNLTREILKTSLSSNLNNAIAGAFAPYNGLSLRQIEYAIKQINPCGRMEVGSREMVAYLFRYNKVKMMFDSGATNTEIQTYFGWLNPPIPWNYNSKIVEVEYYNVPNESFYIMNSDNTILQDSNNDFIISQ
jgi:hypothetical protein